MAKRTAKEWALRLAPLAAIAGLVIAFFALGWNRYLSMDLIREHGLNLQAYAQQNWWIALGAFIAGETFTPHDLGAMAVILAGVVVITLARARQANSKAAPVALKAQETRQRQDSAILTEIRDYMFTVANNTHRAARETRDLRMLQEGTGA